MFLSVGILRKFKSLVRNAPVDRYEKLAHETKEIPFVSIAGERCNCFVPPSTDEQTRG